MLSRNQQQKIDDTKKVLNQLKSDFKALSKIPWPVVSKKDPSLIDLLNTLDNWYKNAKELADSATDPVQAMVYLHEANSYARIMSYINRQLS